jgi:hypothetical protein
MGGTSLRDSQSSRAIPNIKKVHYNIHSNLSIWSIKVVQINDSHLQIFHSLLQRKSTVHFVIPETLGLTLPHSVVE